MPKKCILIFESSNGGMVLKSDIAHFVARCPDCQTLKAGNQMLRGLTQLMDVPT